MAKTIQVGWPAVAIGVALPLLQVFSITTTANHYLIDAAAGGIVAIAGLGVALALRRWGYPWLVAQVRRLPWASARRLLLGDAAYFQWWKTDSGPSAA